MKSTGNRGVVQSRLHKSAKDGNYDVFPLFTLVSAQMGHDE